MNCYPSNCHGDDAAKVMLENGETSVNADANSMKKSLINEGLLILKFCPELLTHESFTNHFKIVEGLCDLLHIIVITMGTKLYSQEIEEMNDCFYKDNFEGILSWAEKVKTINNNHAVKIDAYFKLVDIKSQRKTLSEDWNDYMETLRKDWDEKKILVYVKKNTALELRSLAESTRDSLWKMGLISKKLLMDLKKFQDGHQYYYITANVLSDPSFSPIVYYYNAYFDKADNLFTDLLRIKLDIDDVKEEFEKLVKMIENYFELGMQIISYEAIECWIKLEVPRNRSDNTNSSTESGLSTLIS